MARKRVIILEHKFRKLLEDVSNGGRFNVRNVYHVSDNDFDEFKDTHFGYFFFSDKPISLGSNKYTYVCNLSMHNPFVFSQGESWSYPLWLFLTDKYGDLIREDEFTRDRYDGYLGCPFEFWEIVYRDDEEYDIDQIPKIVQRLDMGYDGVIINGVSEGNANTIVTDYIVFDPSQVEIVTKVAK